MGEQTMVGCTVNVTLDQFANPQIMGLVRSKSTEMVAHEAQVRSMVLVNEVQEDLHFLRKELLYKSDGSPMLDEDGEHDYQFRQCEALDDADMVLLTFRALAE